MGTHRLAPDEVESLIRDYLLPEVVPEALSALEAHGFYMTPDLPRPSSEFLTDLLQRKTGRAVGHTAAPSEDPLDVYFFADDERVDHLHEIHRLAAEQSEREIEGGAVERAPACPDREHHRVRITLRQLS